MKTVVLRIMMLVIAVTNALQGFGDVQINGLYYYLYKNSPEDTILKARVSVENSTHVKSGELSISGDLQIPSEVEYDGLKWTVVLIDCNAFADCTEITSVTIPATVEGFYYYNPDITNVTTAFNGCTSLKRITVDTGNQWMCSVDGVLFSRDTTVLYQYPNGREGSYVVPPSVRRINSNAFRNSIGLSAITIPDNVTELGNNILVNCPNLEKAVLPDHLTFLDCFAYCSSLTTVNVPASLRQIGTAAFFHCEKLQSFAIPDGVTDIGYEAFSGCSSLKNMTVPPSVTSMKDGVFSGCQLEKLLLYCRLGSYNKYGRRPLLGLSNETVVYAYTSEISLIEEVFSGVVLPIEEYIDGIAAPVEGYMPEDVGSSIYNLSGRIIENRKLPKGVYIQNGRKFVVK